MASEWRHFCFMLLSCSSRCSGALRARNAENCRSKLFLIDLQPNFPNSDKNQIRERVPCIQLLNMENIHWKAFLEFETQNELFSCKNKEEIFFWYLLRLDIYIRYMWSRAKTIAARESMGSRVRRYLYWAKSIIKLIFWLFQQKPDLFFLTSRDKSPSKKFHEKNAIDVLQLLKDRAFLLETYYFNGIEYEYDVPSSAFCFNPILIFRQVYHLLFYKKADYSDLTAKIKAGLDIDYTDAEINLAVSNFKADYAFYKFLLKKKGTKRVFLTKSQPPYVITAGIPAIPIKRFNKNTGIWERI